MESITVLRKRPGESWEVVRIDNTLESLYREVGGYIETVTLFADACLIVNEEGRINGMPFNCELCGNQYFGTILLVGVNDEDFTSLTVDLALLLKFLR